MKDLFNFQWDFDTKFHYATNEASKLPLLKRCNKITREYLKVLEPNLFSHLLYVDLDCFIFLQ